MAQSTLFIKHFNGGSNQNRQEKKGTESTLEREKAKLPLLTDEMIIYTENPEKST